MGGKDKELSRSPALCVPTPMHGRRKCYKCKQICSMAKIFR